MCDDGFGIFFLGFLVGALGLLLILAIFYPHALDGNPRTHEAYCLEITNQSGVMYNQESGLDYKIRSCEWISENGTLEKKYFDENVYKNWSEGK